MIDISKLDKNDIGKLVVYHGILGDDIGTIQQWDDIHIYIMFDNLMCARCSPNFLDYCSTTTS